MALHKPLVLGSDGLIEQIPSGDFIDPAFGATGPTGPVGPVGATGPTGPGLSGLTAGRIPYASTSTALVDSANVRYDGSNVILSGLKYPAADGIADQVLRTDAAGNLSWATPKDTSNVIINGGFDFSQRVTSYTTHNSVADDVYCFDRWYALTQTAAEEVLRWNIASATGAQPGPFVARLLQHQAAAQRIGLAQIVEGMNSWPLRGQTITLQAKAACVQTDITLRYAILEWTGTCDTVTSDVVKDWTSGTYTANNFFLATGLTVVAVGSTALTHVDAIASAVPIAITLSGTVSASCNNLIVLFWSEGTMAQHDEIVLSGVDCHIGAARTWSPRPVAQELALCQRYYEKSYNIDVAPGTAYAAGALMGSSSSPMMSTGTLGLYLQYAPKRIVPTPTLYDFVGASGKCSRVTWGSTLLTNNSAVNIDWISEKAATIASVTGSFDATFMAHWVMSAEL